VHSKDITIGVPEWKGYTNADGSGVYFDLLRKVYSDENLKIKIDSYNRTLAKFHNNELDMVIGVFREDIKQGIFPHWYLDTEAPITAFYNKKNTQLTHLSDLEKLTVSWLRGYKFDNFIPYVTSPYLVNKISTGFELVAKKRVDVFIDYPYNLPEIYKKELATLDIMPSRHIYVAFQRSKLGEKLAEQYDNMMPKLRASGELANIYTIDYENSKLADFDQNKEKFIIKTSVTKEKSREKEEPIESKVLDLLIDKNQNFNIELQMGSLTTTDNQVESNICYSNKLKTKERLKKYIFSKPMSIYMGLRLHSDEQIEVTQPIDIAWLLKEHPRKTLSIIKERSYTDSLDNQLNSILSKQVNYLQGDVDDYLNAFSTNKVDFIIEYPSTISNAANFPNKDKFYSYRIKGADNYNLGHIMCKDTSSNKQFIKSINETLTSLYDNQYFIDILYSEVDKNSQKDFYQYYDEAFKIE